MKAADRFKASIAAVLDQLLPERRFLAPARYVVSRAANGKLDARPERDDSGYPALSDVPIRGLAAANAGSILRSGSSVLIGFVHGDRWDPFLLDVLDAPTKYAVEADTITLNGGIKGVARQGDSVMGIMAITTASFTVKAGD